jgi:hypothetical protein
MYVKVSHKFQTLCTGITQGLVTAQITCAGKEFSISNKLPGDSDDAGSRALPICYAT